MLITIHFLSMLAFLFLPVSWVLSWTLYIWVV